MLEVASALANDGTIDLDDLPSLVLQSRAALSTRTREVPSPEWLKARLVASLTRHHGNVSEVAREFGKARVQVQRWARRFGVDPKSFRRE